MKTRGWIGWILAYAMTIGGALASVHWGNAAVTVIAENLPLQRQNCIVIDAGHGGEDGGATSCRGRLEKEYNLEIALRLRDMMHLLGYRTRMIRTTDTSVSTEGNTVAGRKASDLRNRARMVAEEEYPILVSIHQNQFSQEQYHGAQVFYAGTPGSEYLAADLQEKLVGYLNPGSRRKTKKSSGVFLMEKIRCPGVLVECGFISNYQEESMLSDPVYQKKLCCVIGAALDQFLSEA